MTGQKNLAVDAEINTERAYFVTIFSLLGWIILIVFGTLQILVEGNPRLGSLEIVGGFALGFNVLFFHFSKNLQIARILLLATIVSFLLIMLATGGMQYTGIFWYFIFPVAAFFLAGRVGGIIWIGVLYFLTIVLFAAAQLEFATISYSPIEVRQLLVTLFVVSFAIYIYQRVRESAHTASAQSRHDLEVERSRADVIVDNIGEGIVALNKDANITFVNAAAESLLGFKQHSLIGQDFYGAIPLNDQFAKVIFAKDHPLARCLASGKKASLIATLKRSNQSKSKVLSVIFAPIVNEGKVSGAVTSLRDVTEERAVDRAKSEFVTIASHQLRTPISAISWFAEMLLSGDTGTLTQEQHDDVERIHQSSQRMARLVSEMLVVSSLELHNLPIRPQPMNIASEAHKVLKDQLQFIHDSKTPKVKEQYDKDLPEIPMDADVIRSILHHIMANALKYTRADGSVSIEISKDSHKITPSSQGSVAIIVSDNGYGIPKPAQGRIFSKFFRADNIKDKDTDGTGLGLYIVKALLDYVGGSISFTSEEEQGTTFVVRLPLEGMRAREN
ncbi:MAG TPA: ATP-binding protein [Candidatus Saccharimonadales bacterium]|nr:ATP-binding protein [Candidatus Saccharimonadales bacterium]